MGFEWEIIQFSYKKYKKNTSGSKTLQISEITILPGLQKFFWNIDELKEGTMISSVVHKVVQKEHKPLISKFSILWLS